ncbi:hypothetical protein M426DRAFT_13650 [Hypoxylon sp. CI-4A]|nr:hypothetical protein M426DRAFT_13650 [Hypoxylon sp. CI-4A]
MSRPNKLAGDPVECICCGEDFPAAESFELSCWHIYCDYCIEQVFRSAFEEGYPPECCRIPIKLTPLLAVSLGADIWRPYLNWQRWDNSRTKVYCSNRSCGKFITEDYIIDNLSICQSCDAYTCTKCATPYHEGECPTQGANELKEVAKKEGWAQCPSCGTWCEKLDGCDIVKCVCARSFCYKCNNSSIECTCIRYNAGNREDSDSDIYSGDTAHDIGGFKRQERRIRRSRRRLLKELARGAPVLSEESSDDEPEKDDDNDDESRENEDEDEPVISATTRRRMPRRPRRIEEQPGLPCRHHTLLRRLKRKHRCRVCRSSGLPYISECRGCNLKACNKCFKKLRHARLH